MDILKTFGMDGKASDGAWREFGDARLLIASIYGRRHQVARAGLERAIRLAAQDDRPLSDAEILRGECELYADTILLSWERVEEHGQPLEPTREHRIRLLHDAPPFLVAVKQLATEFGPYSLTLDEDARKNSSGSSPGAAGGDPPRSDGSLDSQQAA